MDDISQFGRASRFSPFTTGLPGPLFDPESVETEPEPTTDAGAPEAPATDGQPEPQIPDWLEGTTREEFESMRNAARAHKGAAPLAGKAVELGFKSPDDLEAAHRKLQMLDGVNVDRLAEALGRGEKPQQPEGGDPDDPLADIRKELDEVKSGYSRAEAMRTHEREAEKSATAREKAMGDLLGENPSPREKRLIDAMFREKLPNGLYPDDHPLHDTQFKPHSPEDIESAVKAIKDEMDSWQAEQAVETGKQANKARPKPTGGSRSGQGNPEKSDEPANPLKRTDEEKEASAQRIIDRKRGAPVSSRAQ